MENFVLLQIVYSAIPVNVRPNQIALDFGFMILRLVNVVCFSLCVSCGSAVLSCWYT